ncbi:MAG: helix-turn-helix domain-containing protein [Desulfocapsaceae bacterium]|jgi:predicted transcriptional regulator|nr:helix-turn-helix domain-containing protein [Desulfocapsaceae bacterium]
MKSYLIKQELKKHKAKMVDIAKILGVSHTAVSLVIKGTSKSARIRKAISLTIGKPVSEIWPDKQ